MPVTGERAKEVRAELSFSVREELEEATGRLACNELVIAHNKTVYAIVGNACSPTLLEDVKNLKADPNRSSVGWTTPFNQAWHTVDGNKNTSSKLGQFLSSSQAVSSRFAGLGFLRLWAKPGSGEYPPERTIINQALGTVQPYSPTGNDFTSLFLRYARGRGVVPVMSSANLHGDPEIVFPDDAHAFASHDGHSRFVLEDDVVAAAGSKPLGSYPIVSHGGDQLEVTRAGCFSPELIGRLFEGYDIDINPTHQAASNYPENVFGIEDLPKAYQAFTGEKLRLGILATLGWYADAEANLDAQFDTRSSLVQCEDCNC